jgi:hypothetical protein
MKSDFLQGKSLLRTDPLSQRGIKGDFLTPTRVTTMATISKDSNNNLRGKLGNLVYYESKGQSCVRSMPSKYTDKKSDKQIINRERIKGMGSLFQIFRPAIRYDIANKNSNKAAVFCSLNWKNVSFDIQNYKLDIKYEELVLSNSSMKDLLGLTITHSPKFS